jgi:YHS domain-containing protein
MISHKFQKHQISSEKAAKKKSQYASGKFEYFCNQLPYPFQKNPHQPIAINACVVCHHVISLSDSIFSLSNVKKYWKRFVM